MKALKASQEARGDPKKVELVDEIILMDQEWRKLQFDVEQIRKQQTILSKEIGPKAKVRTGCVSFVLRCPASLLFVIFFACCLFLCGYSAATPTVTVHARTLNECVLE